ncbi:MAG: hypothetical protein HZB41_00905 [Ignavibacteriae bacterium]|nr:hypothetical protein [Ignavibacteriota bacterium]
MKTITDNFIDLTMLPESAKQQVMDFYNFLSSKYNKKERKKKKNDILEQLLPKKVRNFKPLTREEIYGG